MEFTFPQFGLLPTELRCQIWRHSLPCRIIPARLRLNLDTWNSATEDDWWLHYNVVLDGKEPPLPPAALVNREARFEIEKCYKMPLQIDKERVTKAQRTLPLDEIALDRSCERSHIPKFHPQYDVLEWTKIERWGTEPALLDLFFWACLSVEHVSIEYTPCLSWQLEELAFAVLDQAQSPRTLTFKLRQSTGSYRQFRLAKCSSKLRRLEVDEALGNAVMHNSACLLPWCRIGSVDGGGSVDPPHPIINELLAQQGRPPLPAASRLDSRFAIFEILYPSDLRDEQSCKSRLQALASPPVIDWSSRTGFGARSSFFNEHNQVDVALWVREVKRNESVVPYHGFCLPLYGLQ
ncbi:hypothetical protein F5Y19DRAFT_484466 [Xylariaceae sp. FL1651]|nr:hypothetical protein F5Y19DRAFT_484466 [Xylariaceae sp. FL1651]